MTDGDDINSFGEQKITSSDGAVSVRMLGNGGFAAVIE